MPRVPDHILKQSLGAPGNASGMGESMLRTVSAAAGLANSIADAGKEVVAVFEEQQNLENKKTLLSTRNEMRDRLADFENNLDPTNPQGWVDAFDEHANSFKKDFTSRQLAPVVKDAVEQEANSLFSTTRRSIAKAALQKNTSNTRRMYEEEINHNVARGEFDLAQKNLEAARGDKVLDDVDFKSQSRQLQNLEARHGLENLIKKDADQAAELIDDPKFLEKHSHLTLQDKAELERLVTRQQNTNAAEFWEGIGNAALDPENPAILSLEDLNELTKAGKISPSQRASYLRTYHQEGDPVADPAVYSKAAQAIRSYDPEGDPDGFALASLRARVATLPLPKEHLSQLGKLLTALSKPDESLAELLHPSIEKNFSDLTGKYFDQGRFGGWFEMTDHDDDPDTVDRKTILLEDYNKAAATRAKFEIAWEKYLEKAPPDLDPLKASQDFEELFQREVIDKGPSPFTPPSLPKEQDFTDAINKLFPPPQKPDPRTSKTIGGAVYNLKFSSLAGRRQIFEAGGAPILLDTNSVGGKGITEPLVVVPDNATAEQKAAAQKYADQIATYLNPKLGRKMKGRIKTTAENGRGRAYAFHTEPFALTDPAAVRLMTSAEGMAAHRRILQNTLGGLKGAQFFIPHDAKDPGAIGNGISEVEHARNLLRGFKNDLPPGAMNDNRDRAQRAWFDYANPTSPQEIAAGLEELDMLRTISKYG